MNNHRYAVMWTLYILYNGLLSLIANFVEWFSFKFSLSFSRNFLIYKFTIPTTKTLMWVAFCIDFTQLCVSIKPTIMQLHVYAMITIITSSTLTWSHATYARPTILSYLWSRFWWNQRCLFINENSTAQYWFKICSQYLWD